MSHISSVQRKDLLKKIKQEGGEKGKKLTAEDYDKIARKEMFKGLIDPESTFMKSWEILHVILVLYIAIFHIYKVSFLDGQNYLVWDIFDYIVDFYFFVDIILNFFVPFMDSNYVYITEKKKIAMNYLMSSWFVIDIVSVLPLNIILNESYSWNRFMRVVKIPRLYKITKMAKLLRTMRKKNRWLIRWFFNVFQKHGYDLIISNIPFFIIILVVAHVCSCIWYYFNSSYDDLDTWMVSNGFLEERIFDRYISVMYFVYTTLTTTGYGDLSPTTDAERLMGIIMMSSGVMLFARIFEEMLEKMQEMNDVSQIVDEKNYELKILKRQVEIHKIMLLKMERVIRSGPIDKHWAPELTENEVKGIDKVLVEDFDNIFKHFTIFENFTDEIKALIYRKMHKNKYPEKQFIYREGLPADKVTFLVDGSVNLCFQFIVDHRIEYFEFIKLRRGSYFGAIECYLDPEFVNQICDKYRTLLPNKLKGKEIGVNLYSVFCTREAICYEISKKSFSSSIETSAKVKNMFKKKLIDRINLFESSRASLILACQREVSELEFQEQKLEMERREMLLKQQEQIFGSRISGPEFETFSISKFNRNSVFFFGGVKGSEEARNEVFKKYQALNEGSSRNISNSNKKLNQNDATNYPSNSRISSNASILHSPDKSQYRRESILSNGLSLFRIQDENRKENRKRNKEYSEVLDIQSPKDSNKLLMNSREDNNNNEDDYESSFSPKDRKPRFSIMSPFAAVKLKKNTRRQRRMMKKKIRRQSMAVGLGLKNDLDFIGENQSEEDKSMKVSHDGTKQSKKPNKIKIRKNRKNNSKNKVKLYKNYDSNDNDKNYKK